MNKVCPMITTNKTLADITWHPAHSQSDDTHKVMSSRTGELLHKGGIHLRHTCIAVAYVYVVKWSSVFKDLKGDFAERSVSDEKKSSLWIHPSLIASRRLGHFAGETVVCASKTEIAKRIMISRSTNKSSWPDSWQILRHQYAISIVDAQTSLSPNVPSGKEPG